MIAHDNKRDRTWLFERPKKHKTQKQNHSKKQTDTADNTPPLGTLPRICRVCFSPDQDPPGRGPRGGDASLPEERNGALVAHEDESVQRKGPDERRPQASEEHLDASRPCRQTQHGENVVTAAKGVGAAFNTNDADQQCSGLFVVSGVERSGLASQGVPCLGGLVRFTT